MKKKFAKKAKKNSSLLSSWFRPKLGYALAILLVVASLIGFNAYQKFKPNKNSTKAPKMDSASVLAPTANQPLTHNTHATTKMHQPHYEFYTMLPKSQIVIDKTPNDHKPSTTPKTTNTNVPQQYTIQLASFRHFSDADAYKAKLLLAGYHPTIRKDVSNHETHYRIIVGPFHQLSVAETTQANLHKILHTNSILLVQSLGDTP